MWAQILWFLIGSGLILYSVTGGADLGAGVWSLLASGPRKAQQRQAVRQAIAPIWEANHVWLIFVIVVMFSAFSRAFAAIGIALHVPIALALLGIVFRGSAYVFGAYGIQGERARAGWERVFAWASALTPIFLGSVVAGISSGAIRVHDGQVTTGFLAGWTTPFAACVGVFSLSLFALLAAVYLSAETSGPLRSDFRKRALIAEAVSALFAALTLVLARDYAPPLYANLVNSPWTWPVQIATAVAAGITITCLLLHRTRAARYSAAAQVALVVLGWGLALRGHFLLPDLDVGNSSTNPEVMPALAAALASGSVLLLPSLYYLYRVFKRVGASHD